MTPALPPPLPPAAGARHLFQRLHDAFDPRGAEGEGVHETLRQGLRTGVFGGLPAEGSAASGLLVLLKRLGWNGTLRQFAVAMPHFQAAFDVTAMRNVLAHLGFPSRTWTGRPGRLDRRLLPAAHLEADGSVRILVDRTDRHFVAEDDGGVRTSIPIDAIAGPILVFAKEAEAEAPATRRAFLTTLLQRFRGTLGLLIAITLMVDAVALLTSFAVMAIYDAVIPTKAVDTLAWIMAGVGGAYAIELALRIVKARAIGHVSGRLEFLLCTAVFSKLLSFPLDMTSGLPVGAQVARLRQFETIRDLFAGPYLMIVLELPFLAIFVAALVWLAGPLALVPLALAAVYGAIGLVLVPIIRRRSQAAARLSAERDNLMLETFAQMRVLRAAGCEDIWLERLKGVCARATAARQGVATVASLLHSLSAAGVPVAGVATMAAGAVMVMEGSLSVGALIATMIIVWRVLAPMQQAFVAATRLAEITAVMRQLNQFMELKAEPAADEDTPVRRSFAGSLRFADVTFRYPRATGVSLSGVSFSLEAGQSLAVMGASGSGKSTLLRLILALFQPQAGVILLDGVNLRQLDPTELRAAIGFAPQQPTLFHGTLAQNLRLAQPTASDADLARVCDQVGLAPMLAALPQGLDTVVTDLGKEHFPSGLRQSLAIAQALLRSPRLLLLDEPAQGMDADAERAFMGILTRLKGVTTVVMVTNRPSHARLTDRVLVLDRGRLAGLGAPDEILPKLQKAQSDAA